MLIVLWDPILKLILPDFVLVSPVNCAWEPKEKNVNAQNV